MEKIDKAIEILQAFKEGKEIEIWDGKKWLPIDKYEEICRDLYHYHDTLRVKAQPIYHPYANAEEFLKASKDHKYWIKGKTNPFHCNPYHCCDVGITIPQGSSNNRTISYKELSDYYVWADDGSVCGILEQ